MCCQSGKCAVLLKMMSCQSGAVYQQSNSLFLIKLKASNYFDTDDEDFSLSIKYAEDSRLLVLGFEKLEETTYELQNVCIKSGKKINFDKCRVLKPAVDYVLIQGEYTENVKKIVYV